VRIGCETAVIEKVVGDRGENDVIRHRRSGSFVCELDMEDKRKGVKKSVGRDNPPPAHARSKLTWNMAARASMSPHGRLPAHISRTTHPRLQMSTFAEYP
jgi:hypothetical protein